MSKIDIIIPVHNSEKYIESCINSVLNQNFKDYRIILVDDYSTDKSKEIITKYKETYPDKIELKILEENKGAATARNEGLKLSNAKYISFIDSDDTIENGILEKISKIIDTHNPDLICMDLNMEYKKIPINFLSINNDKNRHEGIIYPKEYKKHIYEERPNVICKYFKKEFIDSMFYDGLKWEDFVFIIPYFVKAEKIYMLKEKGYHYNMNIHNTTITDALTLTPKILDIIDGCDLIDKSISKELLEYFKEELKIVKTMNCLSRVKELASVKIEKNLKKELINYYINLINIKYGDYKQLWYYQEKYNNSLFYKLRMKIIDSYYDKEMQKETNEEKVKKYIKDIINNK